MFTPPSRTFGFKKVVAYAIIGLIIFVLTARPITDALTRLGVVLGWA